MRIYCVYTPAHEVLFRDVFAPSVPDGFLLDATVVEEDGAGDFLSPEFLRCVRRKMALVEESLKVNFGNVIVWSDVDVRLLNLTPTRMLGELGTSGADILFQRESPRLEDVNTGFFICRVTPAVCDFFQRVRASLHADHSINEQAAINRLLHYTSEDKLPRWNYLPPAYYARTHGWPPPREMALYHANYTKKAGAVRQKLNQFSELERLLTGGWPARSWSIAKRIPAKLVRLLQND